MNRSIPVSNKKLSKIWSEKNLSIHISHLREIKPRIDLQSPTQFTFLQVKAKNLMMQEELFTKIERENRILLEKMNLINNSHNSRINRKASAKSLNKDLRKNKLVQIALENQAMMQRIKEKKSNYANENFNFQRKKVEKMLTNICEYPYMFGRTQKGFKLSKSAGKRLGSQKSASGLRKKVTASDLVARKQIVLNEVKFRVEITKNHR